MPVLSIFLVPVDLLHIFFGEISIQVFCPFLNVCLDFLDIELYDLFIHFAC